MKIYSKFNWLFKLLLSYLYLIHIFLLFITAHDNCLELIWIYIHIIHFKPAND